MGKKPKQTFEGPFSYPPDVYSRNLRIATHENVSLEYTLAGPGSRFLALFIDKLIRIAVYVVISLAYLLYLRIRYSFDPAIDADRLKALLPALMALYMALTFVRILYHTIFEMASGGSSPGKKLFGVRVMRVTGEAPTGAQYLLRNILRLIDMIPGGELLDGCIALFDKQYRRIGDMAAGTVVVRDRYGKQSSAKSLDDILSAAWEEEPEETADTEVPEEHLPVPGTDAFMTFTEYEMLKKYLQKRRSYAYWDVYNARWARLICLRRKMEVPGIWRSGVQMRILKKALEDLAACYPEESEAEYVPHPSGIYAPSRTEGPVVTEPPVPVTEIPAAKENVPAEEPPAPLEDSHD